MYASNLQSLFAELIQSSDVSADGFEELAARFESLRGYRRLPAGRENRATHLTVDQIAAAILGLTSIKPGWAGHTAAILGGLKPVGGDASAPWGSATLSGAIAHLLSSKPAREALIELTLSSAQAGTNLNGLAKLVLEEKEIVRTVWFVSKMALTLLQPGAEATFDPRTMEADIRHSLSFGRAFFNRLAREVERSLAIPQEPMGDGAEYNASEAEAAWRKALGVTAQSRFLNVGVDTQVTWPKQETPVTFDKYRLVLMPKTREHTQSVHIDLHGNSLTDREALTVINRFLSLLSWCDDQFAVAEWGWSGNPVPVPVKRRNLAFATAHSWPFSRTIPEDENARRALALYREGLNADAMKLTSYAVLSFFKIVELGYRESDRVKKWIGRNIPASDSVEVAGDTRLTAFFKDCDESAPADYIYDACRLAVAHASRKSPTDADDAQEMHRLGIAAHMLKFLARRFIVERYKVSGSVWSDVAERIVDGV